MKIRYFIIIVISIFFSLALVSCSENSNPIFKSTIEDTSSRNVLPMAKQGGINLGLYNTNGNIEENLNLFINENESFEKFISIGNLIDKSRTYKLLAFVDFIQIPFSVDGHEEELEFTFTMQAYQTIEIPIALNSLTSGSHELLFVIVKDPDNPSLDKEYRMNTDMNHLLFIRYNLTVGDELCPPYEYTSIGDIKKDDRLTGVFINTSQNNLERWLTSKINTKEVLQYYLHIGNNNFQEEREYALIMLQDWKQINIQDNPVIYFKLNKNEMLTLPSLTNEILNNGVYNLTPILIHNPYKPLNYKNKEVETGVRVGIEVVN